MKKPSKTSKTRKAPQAARNVGGRPPNVPILPAVVRAKREALGLSRNDVVERLRERGVSVTGSTLYLWERGRHSPDDATRGALCEVLGLRPQDVVAKVP